MNSSHSFTEENQEDEELRCSGCSYFFSSLTKPYLLPCNHNLCLLCIENLMKLNKTFCPICKTPFNKKEKSNFQVNYAFLNLVSKILKTKIILCQNCNKIYFWNDHFDKCDQKYFTDTNEILSEIKKCCQDSYIIIKNINYRKSILSTSKKGINDTIQLFINKIQEKFKEKYSNFIGKLFFSNTPQINIDNSKKEIIIFLEICRDNHNFFNNIDLEELENLLKTYDNDTPKNDILKNYIFSDNNKLRNPKNLIKSTLSKNNKKKIPLQNNLKKNNEEKDEDATLTYEDDFNVNNEISNEIRYSAQPRLEKKIENFDEYPKSSFFIDDILEDIEEPKTINKIIVGLDGVKVFTEKKKINNLMKDNSFLNNNINPLAQSVSNYLSNYQFNKRNFDNLLNEDPVKLSPRGKRNYEIIRKRNLFMNQNNFNNLEMKEKKYKESQNKKVNNSFEINKKEYNEIQIMNKTVKNFNKIKDILNKMNKYSNEYINTNTLLINQIDKNSQEINDKIVSDYCLLLNEISYNFHQSYKRFIISYTENTTKISLYDTRLEKYQTKDFKETLKNFPSLNHSLSVIFDDFDLFFISGGIEFGNYDSSNILLSFRWSSMKIEFIDKMPQKRAFHSSIYFDNNLYIIGGMSEKNNYLNDCYCFNITKKKWIKMPDINITRLNPSLCIYNNNYLYVIRGSNKIESIDNIEFINIKNFNEGWNLFKPVDPGFSWFGCDTSLAITIKQNQILIFGGRDKSGKLYHQSFILDPEKQTIYRGKDIIISANFKFNATVYQDKVIAIDWKNISNTNNHGRHIYDLKKRKWFFEYK